jgi:hypothetical protein
MTSSKLTVLAVMVAGASLVAVEGTVLAQGGTTPQSESMGSSRSGSAIDSDKGESTSPDSHSKKSFDQGFTGQPAGVGEEGSGQSQSTKERSGGKQSQKSEGSSELSEGKTAQAMEEQVQEKSH